MKLSDDRNHGILHMKRLHIADDHLKIGTDMVNLMKQLHQTEDAIAVGSASAAMKALGNYGTFDLVLLDYDMPGINGIKGMAMIHEAYQDQVVGIISGRTEPQLVKAAVDAGAVGWLPKSMSDQPLLHALRMMAAGGRFVPTDVLDEWHPEDDRWSIFSDAEQKVARLLAKALSDKEIAKELQIEPKYDSLSLPKPSYRTHKSQPTGILSGPDVMSSDKCILII